MTSNTILLWLHYNVYLSMYWLTYGFILKRKKPQKWYFRMRSSIVLQNIYEYITKPIDARLTLTTVCCTAYLMTTRHRITRCASYHHSAPVISKLNGKCSTMSISMTEILFEIEKEWTRLFNVPPSTMSILQHGLCSRTIPLSNGLYMLAVNVTLEPNI